MFTAETFAFLRDLRAHNERAWFEANRDRWEAHGKAALTAFIRDFRPHLADLSAQYVADERVQGGSAFRIHRDTRFSKDKSPYKTHLAAQFRHAAVRGSLTETVHAPGLYCHISPAGEGEMEGCFAGFGTWRPEGDALLAIRRRIVDKPEEWALARAGQRFSGEALKRVPAGFDPAHPYADDLRRKDFIVVVEFAEADTIGPGFVERYATAARGAVPLLRFLCAATGLPW